jgi:predicted  nucleic acid-binding Zn-ribbon protein
MTKKRFTTKEEVLDLLNELYVQDLKTKKEDAEYELLHLKEKYEELLEENKQLKKTIAETERMVQSTHDELTRLRYIEKNLKRKKS